MMEFRSIRTAATLLLLLAVVMVVFSCNSSRPENNAAEVAKGSPAERSDDPCAGTINANRKDAIGNYLNRNSMKDNALNGQRGYNFTFETEEHQISPTDTNTYVLVRVRGKVVGVDSTPGQGNAPRMKKFMQFLEGGMRKGCIDRISFEADAATSTPAPSPAPSPSPESRTTSVPRVDRSMGFEWLESCAHPEFACDNTGRCSVGGACKKDLEPTPSPSPSPTP